MSKPTVEMLNLMEENADYKKTISGFFDIKSNLEGKLQSLSREFDVKISTLTDSHKVEIEKLSKSVNRKVTAALAKIGVNEFCPEIMVGENISSNKKIYETFVSMPNGQEKNDFFKKNESVISAFGR